MMLRQHLERARPAPMPGRSPSAAPRSRADALPALSRLPGRSVDRGLRIQLLADLNRTAGNAAALHYVRSAAAVIQREPPDDDPYGDADEVKAAPAAAYTLTNARFTPHARLQEIAAGGPALAKKDPAPAVKAAQTALLDLGYSLLRYKNDGSFGGETAEAIAQFRTDRGVGEGEGLDAAAMAVLDKTTPPPGTIEQHYLDYARLFADGRLDITLGIGYDEDLKSHVKDLAEARAWFATQKMTKTAGAEPPKPAEGEGASAEKSAEEKEKEGISVPETWTVVRSVTYPDKDGARVTKDITVSITLVPPGTGGKAAYAKGLNESELTLYSGHARRGIGPDFDDDKTPYENFVIGVNSALHKAGRLTSPSLVDQHHYVVGKKNDLEAMKDANVWDPEKYRVWFFAACSSIAYIDELRGGLLPEKMDRHNLDVFGTNQPIPIAAGLAPIWQNIEGILAAETMEQIVDRMGKSTLEVFRKHVAEAKVSEAVKKAALKEYEQGPLFMREGAGDNPVAAAP
jgi:peptidoglycan hydrolase-like protein with peptidoglycan-binding domain